MSSLARLARETLVLTGGNLAGLAVGLAGTVLVTRALGPAGRGAYSWLMTLASIAVQVALLAPPASIRALASGSWERRLPATLALLCLLGTVPTLPLALYAGLDADLGAAVRPVLLAAWIGVPLTAAGIALFTLVQVEGRAGPILGVQVGPRVAQLAAILALWSAGLLGLHAAIWLFPATAALSLALVVAALGRGRLDPRPDPALARRLAHGLGLGWLAALALFCLPRGSLLVLGGAAPLEEVGQYGLALALQETALALPVALGGVLVSQVRRSGPPSRRETGRTLLLVGGGSALVYATAALLAPLLVPLVFGAAFRPAAGAFQGLLLAIWFATLFQLCQPLLLRSARARDILLPALAGLAVALATALLCVPRLGTGGAVLSNVLGFAALAVSGLVLASRHVARPARTLA